MGLFDKIKNPVFLKEESEADKQLAALQELRGSLSGTALERLDHEISKVEAGIAGEKQVHFELENSHIPMYVLHDLFLEHEGLTAQIDYLIITRKNNYIIECKNLYGNIEINSTGSFIRTYSYKGKQIKEGIYSPITQNQRHKELIKAIRAAAKSNFITKALLEKNFDDNYHSIVVLANPKTVLNDRYAKKEIKSQVIRADQLVEYIKQKDKDRDVYASSDKDMEELARFFLDKHKENPVDYVEKFRASDSGTKEDKPAEKSEAAHEMPKCPKCGAPMVLRTAKKGSSIGNQFYGCSKFPQCKGIRPV